MYGGWRTVLSYGVPGQGGQRLSLSACAATVLEYYLSGWFSGWGVAKYDRSDLWNGI